MENVSGVCVTRRTITVYFNGVPEQVSNTHRNFEKIREKILGEDHEGLRELFSTQNEIEAYEEATGKQTGLKIENGVATYNGRILDNALGKKFLEELDRERPLVNYVNFLEKVMQNPSKTAVDELLLFIEAGYMGIEPDGDFIAYKRVRPNFRDIYSNSFDNSPGQILEMPRNAVDDDRDRTCSSGFHFCSWGYLPHFGSSGGDRVVMVKINPKDVVAIPSDYNSTKGRACRYEVVQEIEGWQDRDVLASKDFYHDEDVADDWDEEENIYDEPDFDEDEDDEEDGLWEDDDEEEDEDGQDWGW